MSSTTAFILASSLVLSSCGMAAPREPSNTGRATQEAAKKIDRICALPPDERDVQLKKLEAGTGVVLFCGK